MSALPCGHPLECEDYDDDNERVCAWCDEVHNLKERIKKLHEQIGKTAVVVPPGATLRLTGEIGLAEVYGGAIYCEAPNAATTANELLPQSEDK